MDISTILYAKEEAGTLGAISYILYEISKIALIIIVSYYILKFIYKKIKKEKKKK